MAGGWELQGWQHIQQKQEVVIAVASHISIVPRTNPPIQDESIAHSIPNMEERTPLNMKRDSCCIGGAQSSTSNRPAILHRLSSGAVPVPLPCPHEGIDNTDAKKISTDIQCAVLSRRGMASIEKLPGFSVIKSPPIRPAKCAIRNLTERLIAALTVTHCLLRCLCTKGSKRTRIRRKKAIFQFALLELPFCVLLICLVLLPLTDGQPLTSNSSVAPASFGEFALERLNSTADSLNSTAVNVTFSNMTASGGEFPDLSTPLPPATRNDSLSDSEIVVPTQQSNSIENITTSNVTTAMADATMTNATNATEAPSGSPTVAPSSSLAPTNFPTVSPAPSHAPSFSQMPSLSSMPSTLPSFRPTAFPSVGPSSIPSMSPTFNNTQSIFANYIQEFTVETIKFFNDSQLAYIGNLMESYTTEFAPNSIGQVVSEFVFLDQTSVTSPTLTVAPQNRFLRNSQKAQSVDYNPPWQRMLQDNSVNTLTYRMKYESDTRNVTLYPAGFQIFINQNLGNLTADMNDLGISVIECGQAFQFNTETPQPTTSIQPSTSPTIAPTVSASPTGIPSFVPSSVPSGTASEPPSQAPSEQPTDAPTSAPTSPPSSNTTTMIIVIVVVAVALLVAIALFVFYRKRKRLQDDQFNASQSTNVQKRGDPGGHRRSHSQGGMDGSWNAAVGKSGPPKPVDTLDPKSHYSPDGRGSSLGHEGLISPSESLVSNQSLLSAGNSIEGNSGDEADATQKLQDEFDQYKDKNLEKMRAEVEGSVTGFDGMMSQALTKALMDDDEVNVEPTELLWGGVGQQSGAEVEASALCEVTDWLKRNDNAPIDGK